MRKPLIVALGELMRKPQIAALMRKPLILGLVVLTAVAIFLVISRWRRADTRPLEGTGIAPATIEKLHELSITNEEVVQVAAARRAGLSDDSCLELVQLARSRSAEFTSGDAVAGLLDGGMSQEGVMELGRQDQLGPWAGEARALLLAGVSENVILTLARRLARGLPTLSSPSVAKIKNVGASEGTLIHLIERGATDRELPFILSDLRPDVPPGFRRQPR